MRIDRDEYPTIVEAFFRTVDWPFLPREGDGLDFGNDCPVTIESVGYGFDGYPNVFMGERSSTTSKPPNSASWVGAWSRCRLAHAECRRGRSSLSDRRQGTSGSLGSEAVQDIHS